MNAAPIFRALRIQLLIALVVGGLAGWFSIITQDGAVNVAQTASQFFLGLGIGLPVALVAYTRVVESIPDRRSLLLIGIVSACLGIIAYIAIVTLIGGSIGGEDLNQVRIELGARIPLWQYVVVIVVQVAVALIMPIDTDGDE